MDVPYVCLYGFVCMYVLMLHSKLLQCVAFFVGIGTQIYNNTTFQMFLWKALHVHSLM